MEFFMKKDAQVYVINVFKDEDVKKNFTQKWIKLVNRTLNSN